MALANQAIRTLNKKLGKRRLFYVCRDIERSVAGLDSGLAGYRIITNASTLARELAKKYPGTIFLSPGKKILDTQEILRSKTAKKIIRKDDFVLVFKPTSQIEKICKENNWRLINPPAKLASDIEEKISQVNWLGDLKKLLPLVRIDLAKNIANVKTPFILQFNRAHTGEGTHIIRSASQLKKIQNRFPDREVRISKFLHGPTITSNNVVLGDKVIAGNISYQITGLSPFTDNRFATVGNDWALPDKLMTIKQRQEYFNIVSSVGKKLSKSGWRGLFGIDAIIDEKTGRVKLIEINARQPASTSFESVLQKLGDKNGLSIFEAHLLSLFGLKLKRSKIIKIRDGAQLVQRVTTKIPRLSKIKFHKKPDWRLIRYDNAELGADLLRMQTAKGVMDKHGILNDHGNELSICVSLTSRNTPINLPRAGMIIIKNRKILLIERRRFGYHYFVLPGGSVEKGESRETTAKREIYEETGLRCKIDKERKPVKISGMRDEIYYFAENCSGRPTLGGPERQRNSRDNHYALKYIDIAKLKNINMLPAELKERLKSILK